MHRQAGSDAESLQTWQEKTREFIRNLQVFEATITGDSFDYKRMMTQLEQFGNRHMVGRHIVNRMLSVAEELCIGTILPHVQDDKGIMLRFEYSESEDDSISVRVTYAGENADPLQYADELSAVLIRHILRYISFSYEEGTCRIDAELVM